jgi:hypothetical protein
MYQIRVKVKRCMRVFSYLDRFYARMLLKIAGDKSSRRNENQCNNKMYYCTLFDMSGTKPLCFIGRSVLILHAWEVCDTHTLYGVCRRHLNNFINIAPHTHTHTHTQTHTHIREN